MLSGVIERRPWAVIVAWILVVALLAQYAGQLNDVVKTETTEFLPESMESVRAERVLNSLYNSTGSTRMQADYLVMVHGVPVGLDLYYKFRDDYLSLKSGASGDVLSWIDIVYNVEENISSGMEQGLNGSMMLVRGALGVNYGFIQFYNGVNQTRQLVVGVDKAYSSLYSNLSMLAENADNLSRMAGLLGAVCSYQGIEAQVFYDVVRSEAILELNTTAYQNGSLSQWDLGKVLSLTNLTGYGIEPVSPELVALVFNTTLMAGGPDNFSNILAVQLASQVARQMFSQGINQSELAVLEPFLNASDNALISAVGSLPDLRGPIIQSGPLQGQLALLNMVESLRSNLTSMVLSQIASQLGGDEQPIIYMLASYIAGHNCNSSGALEYSIASFLNQTGLPWHVAESLSRVVAAGVVPRDLVLNISVQMVLEHLPSDANVSQVIPVVRQLVLALDPNGAGNLSDPVLSTAAACYVAMTSQGIQLPVTVVANWTSMGDPESVIRHVYKQIVYTQRGPDAASIVELLENANLLGADNSTILSTAPQLFSGIVASQANISVEQAAAILSMAVEVVRGNTTFKEAVDNLTRHVLEQAWPSIEEKLKGLMIEKDGNGFLVLYIPATSNEENIIAGLNAVESSIREILSNNGYQGFTTLKGGTEYMTYEMKHAVLRDVERSDRMSMIFVLIMMAIVLESLAAVFLPFIGIGFGLVTSMAIVFFLAKAGVIDVTTHSRTIMYSTGLGLGIDYAVYVSRSFREAARQGANSRVAAAIAFQRSWKPVLAGALTAMIGFGSMMLAGEFAFISSIGATVPLTILLVMLASITFIPALLAYVGEKSWFWWPRHPFQHSSSGKTGDGLAVRIGRSIVRAAPILLIAGVVLGVVGYWVVSNYQGSYDMSLNLPEDTESYRFLQSFNEYYDPGVLYPVYIIASTPVKALEINDTVSGLDCVSKTRVDHGLEGRVVFVYMKVNPLSAEGISCAQKIREEAHRVDTESLVGGFSASNLDFKEEITRVFYHKVYPVAIVLMFLTMLAAYGGVLTSLSAVVSVVLAAYLGSALTILVYEHVRGLPVLWYLPVITFTAILGVGMDYNSFYLARARHECDKRCTRDAVAMSIANGTLVVMGLATIMASAYLGLAFTKTPGIASMGLALLLGVLLAGLYSSLVLTPPLIALLGRKAWWPRTPKKEG